MNTGDHHPDTPHTTDDADDTHQAATTDGTDQAVTTDGTDGTDDANGTDQAVTAELNRLRESIDNIDAAVVHMLAERFKCTQQVGLLKARHHLPPADPPREARQIARLRQLAETANLDPAFAEKLLNFIIAEVIRHHERIATDPPTTHHTPG